MKTPNNASGVTATVMLLILPFSVVGGDPGGIDDCSVGASDLPGLLQDMGVVLNTTQAAFLIQASKIVHTIRTAFGKIRTGYSPRTQGSR